MPLFGKVIVIKRTGADGYNFPLTSSSCLFGRKSDCDIRIQLPHVSKEHCKLEVNENNEVILTNLSEVNQTLLNGKIVHHSERLKHRDTFTVIDRSFRFEYPLDSVHNTSPRKKRNSSTLKNETLQGVDGDSQSSIKDHSSSSEQKSDKIKVDKGFRVPTKSPKVTPDRREDPGLQNQHRRNFTKILDNGKATDPESFSPFTALYEMVKQQATSEIQTKSNKVVFESVEEGSTDLIKQTCIPEKESNVTISQNGKNPRASASGQMSRRISKTILEEGMMAKEDESKDMRELNPLLIEDFAATAFSVSTADINTPKKNKMDKCTEQPSSDANVTSITLLAKSANGKEQDNDQITKGTPKGKDKSQFINRKSLTLGATPKNFEDSMEPSVEKEQNMVVKHTSFEMEHIPGNIKKKKGETPKISVKKSMCSKNVEGADIGSEQDESTKFSEPSVAKSGVENYLVRVEHTPVRKDEENVDTPKRRGRPSLRHKNMGGADTESEQVESTNILESSVAKSGMENNTVNLGLIPVKIDEKVDTPKRRSRSSSHNKKVDGRNIDSKQVESTNVLESSVEKSDMERNIVNLGLVPVKAVKEKADTPKRRNQSSLRSKNVDGGNMELEQVELTNVLEPSVAKSGMENDTANKGLTPVKIGEEKVDIPRRRRRSSLYNKNVDGGNTDSEQVESTNVLESSVEKSDMESNTVSLGLIPVKVDKEKADTPKRRSRSSSHNKKVDGRNIDSKQVESTNVLESSVEKSDMENNTVNLELVPVKAVREKADTPKRRSQSSLRSKNVDVGNMELEQVELTNVLGPSVAKSGMENDAANKGLAPVKIGEEKVDTPKRQSQSSLYNKNVDGGNIGSEQVESTNVLESSAEKLQEENNSIDMGCMAANERMGNIGKRRGRLSLRNKNVEAAADQLMQTEITNVSKSLTAQSEVENNLVDVGRTAVKIDEGKVDTPKRQGRPSLHNKMEAADIYSEQTELADVLELSKSCGEIKSVKMQCTQVKIDEGKSVTPKRRGRPSLRDKNVETVDVQGGQAVTTEVLESSVTAKSEFEAKSLEMQHAGTPKNRGRSSLCKENVQTTEVSDPSSESPTLRGGASLSSPFQLSKRKESNVAEDPTKVESLKRKDRTSRSPHGDLTNKQTEKRKGHVGLMNVAVEELDKSSFADVKQDQFTSSEESPSASDVQCLSKKRRSENEIFYGPVLKRKRVSFGANLSPEVFDKHMPPCSPLRKGGTPTRVSTPFRLAPHAVLKRTSSIGIRTCAIQECSEQNENYTSSMVSNMPSASASPKKNKISPHKGSLLTTNTKSTTKRSPSVKPPSSLTIKQSPNVKNSSAKMPSAPSSVKRSPASGIPSQKKVSSSDNKKSPCAKTSSTFLSSRMSHPITAGSFGSPQLSGRFSISHVATPPTLPQSVKPCITPKTLSLARLDPPQQKPISGKKASRKSTRKSVSLLAGIQSRRQSGASVGNLLVKKSWAQVVKEGVARTQLQNAAKQPAAKRKRARNVVSLKVTPARVMKDHFSTGHAASPATIVIGKSQATNAKPTGQAPRLTRTVSLRQRDKEMDESFTGVAEMFSTPISVNEKANLILQGSTIVDDAQTALVPIFQKILENSATETPEEAGVKAVTPPTIPSARSVGHRTVSRLLKCRADLSCSSNSPCETTSKVIEISSEAEDIGELQRIMKTPRVKGQPVEDMVGVKRIMKTPRVKGQPVEDMVGVKRIMKTPRVKGQPVEDMVGVKRIMKTPRVKGQPVEDMVGVKRIMKTPRVKEQPVEDMVGLKRIMKTPRAKAKPMENFVGLHKLLAEPKQKPESPEISYIGIKNVFCAEKEMENCDYSGLGEMFSTPVKSGSISDSELQFRSGSSNKPSTLLEIYGDRQATDPSENNVIQTVENGASRKETPSSGTDRNSSLTPRARVTRTRGVQAKSVSSPSSQEECIQQSHQAEASRTFPKDGLVDFPQTGIAECKDGRSVRSTQVSPATKSLKEKKIEDTDAEESIKSTPGKNGCAAESIEEVSKMGLTKKILDADVKIFMPNKITPGKKPSPCKQTVEVNMFNPQRSSKEKDKIPNIPNVEFETPEGTTKGTIMSKNESPDKKIELNYLVSPITKSLRGRKNVKDVQSAKVKELFTLGKITPTEESQDGQICEVKENASPGRKTLKDKEIQNVQDAKVTKKRPQRKKETKNSKINDVEETASVAKVSQNKGAQCAQIELVNSPLEKLSQEKNEIVNVEFELMKNRQVLPKMSMKNIGVKDLPVEDVKAPIATGRPRRRKNINTEETEMQKPSKTTITRKKAACCTQIEVVKESSSKEIVNSVPEGSVREEMRSENVEVPKKVDWAGSKYRSTRGKRVFEELLSEDFKQGSAPVKRLREGEELDETLPRKTVHWGSNLTSPKVSDKTVEISEGTSNGKEVPKRSCRGKVAIKKVSRKVASKSPNSKIITEVNKFHESDEQPKGSPEQKEINVPCEPQLIKKEKNNDDEMKREEREIKQHAESALKLAPSPIKRLLRKKAGQKLTQNKEEDVKELPCTRKLRRNITEQKLKATIDDGPHVPVKIHSSREQNHVLNEEESMPSSRIREKGKQAKESLTKNKEQSDQQQTVDIVDVQLDTTNENEPPSQKIKGKGRQRGKTSAKGTSACLSNVEGVSVREGKAHLNVSVDCTEVVSNSDKIEAIKQTRFSSKGKVSKTAAGVSEVTHDTKKTDTILTPVYEENARPKRNIRRGKSEKELEITDTVEIPRKGGRGTIKRNTSAGSNQELIMDVTKSKQVENSVNKVEKKRSRTGQNNIKETATLSVAQGGKDQVTNKRGRTNLREQRDDDENLLRGKEKTEDNSREQETGIISMDSSQVSKRVTRAKKSCEATEMEQKLLQPPASGSLTPVSAHASKRTLRGKPTVAETTADVPAKKAKKEQMTGKETSQCSKTGRATAKKVLSISPQTAKPRGRTTRLRK
ncbi:proliferation marker protein Ki-67 isoform X2 [Pristis pectinata]|uniref:proliferation marker protein Ki-67 isoform X2 n=1 Tax=Pristis pectinata TaxID=685728 RepID=UPI00223D1408|nr:proliferation marker protein Ki-67 isoform X2 [Pristis pectinata]